MNTLRKAYRVFLAAFLPFALLGANEGSCQVLDKVQVEVRVLDPQNTATVPVSLAIGEETIPVSCQSLYRGPYAPPAVSCYAVLDGVTPGFIKWGYTNSAGARIQTAALSAVVRTCKAYVVDGETFGVPLNEQLLPAVDPGTCAAVPIL